MAKMKRRKVKDLGSSVYGDSFEATGSMKTLVPFIRSPDWFTKDVEVDVTRKLSCCQRGALEDFHPNVELCAQREALGQSWRPIVKH